MTCVSSQSNSPHSICNFPSQSFQHCDCSHLFCILRRAALKQNDPDFIGKKVSYNEGQPNSKFVLETRSSWYLLACSPGLKADSNLCTQSLPLVFDKEKSRAISCLAAYFLPTLVQGACWTEPCIFCYFPCLGADICSDQWKPLFKRGLLVYRSSIFRVSWWKKRGLVVLNGQPQPSRRSRWWAQEGNFAATRKRMATTWVFGRSWGEED